MRLIPIELLGKELYTEITGYIVKIERDYGIIDKELQVLEAINYVLSEREFHLKTKQLELETNITLMKHEYLRDGVKSTEAKEKAKIAHKEEQVHIYQLEEAIQKLKASRKILETYIRSKIKEYNKCTCHN